MAKSIVIATPSTIALEPKPEPLPADWVLSGTPEARSKMLVRSHDWTSSIVAWECTAGSFHWHYNQDEAIMVVSGEAFMTTEKGDPERRFGPGDLGFFPAGTTCTWRVPEGIRKIAVLREPMWRPLGFGLKVWHKLLRTIGLTAKSPLMLAIAAAALWSHR